MNRNLKDDLEVVEKARQFTKITGWGSKEFHELSPYFSKFHEEGLDIAKHAIERALKAEKALGNETILNGRALAKLNERALKAEALVNELKSDSKTDDAVMEGQAKRIKELEVLVRELAKALEVVETFFDAVTSTKANQKLLDAISFARMVMPKAKEVLGDE